jgi:hypothetical protein
MQRRINRHTDPSLIELAEKETFQALLTQSIGVWAANTVG